MFPYIDKNIKMRMTVARENNFVKMLSRYEPFYQDNISLLTRAQKGLQPKAVFDFISMADLPENLVEFALNKSMKTFRNYKLKKTVLDANTSEKLLKLFALYSKGIEVFGSLDAFADWLSKPAYGIGNRVPHDLIGTMIGIDLINEELIRIEYGDLT